MQREEVMFNKVFSTAEPVCKIRMSIKGVKCDKADTCDYASEACRKFVWSDRMICDPTKRYMYCYEWKRKLGMVFSKELGIYILPQWKDELMRRANQ